MATRWGIAGAGKISHDFVTALGTLPKDEHEVLAIAARDLSRAQTFSNMHKIEAAYDDYAKLAENQDIDVVYIGTVNPQHFEIAKLMLNHGKHVLCEKPLTMNLKQTTELINLARSKKLFLMEAIWSRCFPVYEALKKEIDSGSIGDIHQVLVSFGFNMPDVERLKKLSYAEEVRLHFPLVNKLISRIKKIFVKAPLRIETYCKILKNTPLPPEPILTRWDTWIEAALFYAEHFDKIKEVVQTFKEKDAATIKTAQDVTQQDNLVQVLIFIKAHLSTLHATIEKLETVGLPLNTSMEIYMNYINYLKGIAGGGTVLDLGVYGIQFACFIFNNEEPHTISAVGCLNKEGVDQSVSASLIYKGNRTATIVTHSLVDLPNEAYIIGTKGTIKVPNFWCPTTVKLPSGTVNVPLPEGKHKFNFVNSAGLRYEAIEVRNCILKGMTESPKVPHNVSLQVAQLEDTIRKQIGVVYPED